MNNIFSKTFVVECLREANRADTPGCPECVYKTRREASTIYVALIGSRQPRTSNAFSVFDAKRVPPVTVLPRPASLGSSASMLARSRSGIGNGQ
jgi:hypothetical protein